MNRKHPLSTLLEACRYYVERKKQRLTFEYILIENVNDSLEQRTRWSGSRPASTPRVNLIPYNTVEGLSWARPSQNRQETFQRVLRAGGVASTLRREKGHDIAAACGQLRRQTLQKA